MTRHALMRSLEIVVLPKGCCDSLNRITITGALDLQAFFVIGSMITLYKAIEIGTAWGTDRHLHAQAQPEAQKG